MARLHVEGENLVVKLGIVDTMLSVRSTMRFPLTAVERVYFDPYVGDEPRGIKAPGTHLPGVVTKGTFHSQGVKTFWNVWRGTSAVVVELSGQKFDRLVIDHNEPEAVVQQIEAAKDSLR